MKELLIILFQDSFSIHAVKKADSREFKNPLEHMHSITQSLPQDKFLFYDNHIPAHPKLSGNENYKEYLQLGIDEQERMLNAFVKGFIKDYDSIVLIKSNFPALTSEIIKEAFIQIRSNEYVIGPSKDGNFYLLGMKKLDTCLFEVKTSEAESKSVYEEIISTLEMQNLTYHKLQELAGFKKENLLSPKAFLKSKVKDLQLISQN